MYNFSRPDEETEWYQAPDSVMVLLSPPNKWADQKSHKRTHGGTHRGQEYTEFLDFGNSVCEIIYKS